MSTTGLYRLFNARWDRGGRYYGAWWQNIPSYRREVLTFDGEPTAERDHRELHPRLLYGLAGERLEGRAYKVGGIVRPVAKMTFNVLLNAPSRRAAIGAVAEALQDEHGTERGETRREAARLCQAVADRHEPIARWLGSGAGLYLQSVDSEMARQTMATLRKQGIIALCLHDGFRVQKAHAGSLDEAKDAAFGAAISRLAA